MTSLHPFLFTLLFSLYLVSSLALWTVGHGYYSYQTKIPNGQHVPHPCKPNYIWHGVGHHNPLGGGERNQYGHDFDRLGGKVSILIITPSAYAGQEWVDGKRGGDVCVAVGKWVCMYACVKEGEGKRHTERQTDRQTTDRAKQTDRQRNK